MNTRAVDRQPHAVLDLPSRNWKALKIERLLDLAHRPQPIRMLEIGGTSGSAIVERCVPPPYLSGGG